MLLGTPLVLRMGEMHGREQGRRRLEEDPSVLALIVLSLFALSFCPFNRIPVITTPFPLRPSSSRYHPFTLNLSTLPLFDILLSRVARHRLLEAENAQLRAGSLM